MVARKPFFETWGLCGEQFFLYSFPLFFLSQVDVEIHCSLSLFCNLRLFSHGLVETVYCRLCFLRQNNKTVLQTNCELLFVFWILKLDGIKTMFFLLTCLCLFQFQACFPVNRL